MLYMIFQSGWEPVDYEYESDPLRCNYRNSTLAIKCLHFKESNLKTFVHLLTFLSCYAFNILAKYNKNTLISIIKVQTDGHFLNVSLSKLEKSGINELKIKYCINKYFD